MTDDQVYEVIEKLIGRVTPTGDESRDNERYENMKVFISVFSKMHEVIDNVSYEYKDCHQSSIKRVVKLCDDHLDSMGIEQ